MSDTISLVSSHILGSEDWGKSGLAKRDIKLPLAMHVSHLHFVAHTNEENMGADGMPPTNHWSMFLQTGNSSSVHLDAVPGEPNKTGMLIAETTASPRTNDAIHLETVVPPPGTTLTVADIFAIIIEKKRDQYYFAEVGEGCRFWLATLASDLADKRTMSPEDADRVRQSLCYYWPHPAGTPAVRREIVQGRFE